MNCATGVTGKRYAVANGQGSVILVWKIDIHGSVNPTLDPAFL